MSIGVGIIGGGIFAREEHFPAVEAAQDLTLKAVYSRSLNSARSLGTDGAKVDLYSDDSGEGKRLIDLLDRSDVHAVIIALPILAQPGIIKLALSMGKHVLSEKPIAENLKIAQELIEWYQTRINASKVTWGVAENFRYLNSFDHARSRVEKLGRILSFRVRLQTMLAGGKYLETGWRRVPSHQGGFLLDGGIHFVAGLRLLLGVDYIERLSAFTTQLQEHLPPVDTLDACLKTASGATGTVSISFGTTMTGSEWTLGCEGGSVSLSGTTITTVIDGKDYKDDVLDERSGVTPEVRTWGKALMAGKPNPKQSPAEALADLELLENMLSSGEKNGAPIDCVFQKV